MTEYYIDKLVSRIIGFSGNSVKLRQSILFYSHAYHSVSVLAATFDFQRLFVIKIFHDIFSLCFYDTILYWQNKALYITNRYMFIIIYYILIYYNVWKCKFFLRLDFNFISYIIKLRLNNYKGESDYVFFVIYND